MGPVRWALATAALAWAGYGWGAQVALPVLAVRQGPVGRRRVALTFDDGPDPRWTPRLLEVLAAGEVRATFFVVGERAARHADLLRAIVAGGHEVGTHSWAHRNAWLLEPRASAAEVRREAHAVEALTGGPCRFFRPPWGIVNLATLRAARQAGLTTVLWSLQPEGLGARDPGRQLDYLARRLGDGTIVDLHDAPGLPGAPERLLRLLPGLLGLLSDRGLAPVTVGTLLGST